MTPQDEKERNEITWLRKSEAKILRLIENIVKEMFTENQNNEESVVLYSMLIHGLAVKLLAMNMDSMEDESHKEFLKDTNEGALEMLKEKKKLIDGFHQWIKSST